MKLLIDKNLLQLSVDGNFDAIAHQTNCQCKWGRGLAKSLKEIYPRAYNADLRTGAGEKEKLGSISYSYENCNLTDLDSKKIYIFNLYGQFRYGFEKKTNELFLISALKNMKCHLIRNNMLGCKIGLPFIGMGRGHGDERIILENIKLILDNTFDVSMIYFKKDVNKKYLPKMDLILPYFDEVIE